MKNKINYFIVSVLLIFFGCMFISEMYYQDVNTNSRVKPRIETYLEKVKLSSKIIIEEETNTTMTFRIIDGTKNPDLFSGVNLESYRRHLRFACDNFNPSINCKECKIAKLKYSKVGYVSIVEVSDIPEKHRDETIEDISSLLIKYIAELNKSR